MDILSGLIAAGFLGFINLLLGVSFFRLYKREKRRLLLSFKAYFESPDADTPSEFNNLLNAFGDILGAAILKHAKMSALGQASVNSRIEKKVESTMVKDMIGQANPMLAGIIKMFPGVEKLIDKNPGWAPIVAQKAGEYLQKQSESSDVIAGVVGGNGQNMRIT